MIWAGLWSDCREEEWKLYFGNVGEIEDSDKGPVLILLKRDPAEATKLALQHPEKIKEMRALAQKLAADIEADSIPLGGPAH